MQIKCSCGEVLKISELSLGKQGICPSCFQSIKISNENECVETLSEFIQRMEKKGLSAFEIQQKMLQNGIPMDEIQASIDEFKKLLPVEARESFGNRVSLTQHHYQKEHQGIPPDSQSTKWVFHVLFLYLLLFILLTPPLFFLAFPNEGNDFLLLFSDWPYYFFLLIMLSSQAVLLLVPVRIVSRRPVHRRHLFFPILLTGFMMGVLLIGSFFALIEFLFSDNIVGNFFLLISIGMAILIWVGWTVVFYRMSKKERADDLVSKQCRLLLKGSILELLIAVPTHIVVRGRDYCCAGLMTFLGIALGISIMLFSFGPSVYFLFVDRWQKLQPKI